VRQNGQRALDRLFQIERAHVRPVRPTERPQALDDVPHPLDRHGVGRLDSRDRLDDAPHVVQLVVVDALVFQDHLELVQRAADHVVVAVERAHGRVDLVGDPGDQLAQSGHLGLVDHVGLRGRRRFVETSLAVGRLLQAG
jgi:hypothetical protein